jgi:hypothetical protein
MGEPDLPCGDHGPDAICDRCPARYTTDGHGFPHPKWARGRRRLQHCARCGEAVERDMWEPYPAMCCRRCAAEPTEREPGAAAGEASTAIGSPPR